MELVETDNDLSFSLFSFSFSCFSFTLALYLVGADETLVKVDIEGGEVVVLALEELMVVAWSTISI